MSKLSQMREVLDNRLDRWDAQLDALEAQLEKNRDEIMERVQQNREQLAAAANRLKEAAEDTADLSADEARALRGTLDELRVQLALGRADTLDAFESQQESVRRTLRQAEEGFDRLGEKFHAQYEKELERFTRLADRLRAEGEAAELQFALLKADQRDAMARGRKELQHRLAQLRAETRRQSKQAAESIDEFEKKFASGVEEFRDAFLRLIGRH